MGCGMVSAILDLWPISSIDHASLVHRRGKNKADHLGGHGDDV